jgi:hypothetical protein
MLFIAKEIKNNIKGTEKDNMKALNGVTVNGVKGN